MERKRWHDRDYNSRKLGRDDLNVFKRLRHLFNFGDPNAKAAIVSDLETYGTGLESEITMDELVQYRNTDTKFRLAVMLNTAYSVGIGYHNTADTSSPTGRGVLQMIDDFCDEWDLDTLNQLIALDVWATGNAFLRPMGKGKRMEGIQMIPVSSIIRIKRDIDGTVDHYEQNWGTKYQHLDSDKVYHFKWLPENASAWGVGLGQSLAYKGVGYKTAGGNTVRRPSMFAISEMMTDIEAKMVYAGLPRFDIEAEGVKDNSLQQISDAYERVDPMQHMARNFKGKINTISLDTQNRFDSFIRSLDDSFLNGIMTPIPRMFSSLNFTYASADAAIEAYLPLIRMYQRAHKRFIENYIYKPLIMQERNPEAVKRSKIQLNWGQQTETSFEEIKEVYTILKDPMFEGRFDPEDILDMIRQKVPQIKVMEEPMAELDSRVRELANLTDKKEKKIPIGELPIDDQYKHYRAQILEGMVKRKI